MGSVGTDERIREARKAALRAVLEKRGERERGQRSGSWPITWIALATIGAALFILKMQTGT
jgi:hypothetical protein